MTTTDRSTASDTAVTIGHTKPRHRKQQPRRQDERQIGRAMGAAKYIGRVGALAVALGIGAAVTNIPGVAWADPDSESTSSSDSSATSSSSASESDSTSGTAATDPSTDPAQPSTTPSTEPTGGEHAAAQTHANSAVPQMNVHASGGAHTSDDDEDGVEPTIEATPPPPLPVSGSPEIIAPTTPAPTTAPDPADAPQSPAPQDDSGQEEPEPTSTPPMAPDGGAIDNNGAQGPNTLDVVDSAGSAASLNGLGENTQVRRFTAFGAEEIAAPGDQPLLTATTPDASAFSTAQTTMTAAPNPMGALMALPGTVISVATSLVAAVFAPFLSPGPVAPAQPPLLWAVLAFVRREVERTFTTIQRTFFNRTPVATGDPFTTPEDAPLTGNVLINDTDSDDDPLTATLVTGPAHGNVTLNPDGSFTYTPDVNYNGTDTFTYRATDETSGWHMHGLFGLFGGGHADTANVTINITAVNDAPMAVDDNAMIAEDSEASGNVLTNDSNIDSDTSSLTAALGTGPANGTAVVNADGTFTYTPDADFNGTDTFTYTVYDGAATDSGTVTVTITPVQDAPDAVNDRATVAEDSGANVIEVSANDADVDGDDVTITSVTQPANGTAVINGDGTVSYTPNANYTGPDTFTYTVSDGLDDDTAAVTVTVTAVNDAPVAVDDQLTTNEDTPLDFTPADLLDNDSDADSAALVTFVQSPSNGSLTVHADGSYTYTPDANFHGIDTFRYVANDGAATSNIATVTVTVTAEVENTPPVAVDDPLSTAINTPLTITEAGLLANDNDAENDALSVVLVAHPSHGTLTASPDDPNAAIYTPDPGFKGTDSFTYRAFDGEAQSNLATVTITVGNVNNVAPVAVDDPLSTAINTPLTITEAGLLANDNDAESDALSVVLVAHPSHGTLTASPDDPNAAIYTPDPGFKGTDSFTYRAFDGEAQSNLATVTITVGDPSNNAVPVANDNIYTTQEDTPLTITTADLLANDFDADDDALVLVSASPPNRGTLTYDPATNQLTYTPDAGFKGTDTFTYRISDGQDQSNDATVAITVGEPTNTAPVAGHDVFKIPVNAPHTITPTDLLGNDFDIDNDDLSIASSTRPPTAPWKLTPTATSSTLPTQTSTALTPSPTASPTARTSPTTPPSPSTSVTRATTPSRSPTTTCMAPRSKPR